MGMHHTKLTLLLALLLLAWGCEEDSGTWTTDDDAGDDDGGDDDTGDDDTGDDDTGDDDTGDDDTAPPEDEVYLWPPLDFGDVHLGCDEMLDMELVNDTADEVVVEDLAFVEDTGEATLGGTGTPPWTVPAGEAVAFTVHYHPQVVDAFDLPLEAITDHPDFGSVVQDVVGQGLAEHDWMDGFESPESSLVDILWVVDNSCSMQSHQATLASMATAFIGFLETEGMDYQIGVVTTDNGHLQGKPTVIDSGMKDAAETFAATVDLGTNGSGTERPLQFGLEAVTPPLTDPGGPNEGFLREPAGLAVILLTDEPDQSGGPASDYTTGFLALKTNPDRVAVSAVYNADTVCGGQETAPRIDQVVADTGGVGVCIWDQDWMPVLSTIPAMVMAPLDRFELTFVPMPATIEVTVNGKPVTSGWHYDPPLNAIVFEPGSVPEPGDEILVYYVEPAENC